MSADAPGPKSGRRRGALAVGLLLAVALVLGVPVLGATSQGGVALLGAPASGFIHYRQLLSCRLIGVGDFYWQGGLHFGCNPIVA